MQSLIKEGLTTVTNFNWQRRAALKGSAATAALTIALLAGPAAYAQDSAAAAGAADTETIVVTGSLIKNPNLERAMPVSVTTASDIELRATNNAEAILREIPGVVPSIGSAVNNGNGGSSFVNLRGLGSNRNLVLLDGNRLVPADLRGQFDLNNIPVALLERVDVLTGGASTTYGADAISGVVNFITRRDFSGVELSANTGITQKGDGSNFRADLTIGTNLDDGRGNVVISLGYQEVDPVYQGARDFSVFNLDSYSGIVGGSGTSVPTRFTLARIGTRQMNQAGTDFSGSSLYAPYNFNPWNIFQTPFKRFNIYSAGRYEINDAVEVYARGLFSRNSVSTIIAPSGAFALSVQVPMNNPYLTAAQRNAFCVNSDFNPNVSGIQSLTPAECTAAATATGSNDPNYRQASSTMWRRATEFGPRVSEFITTYFDYTGGARGGITDNIDWDVSIAYGESENRQTQYGYWLNSRVRSALLDGSVNFFGPEGSITDAMNQQLTGNSTVSTGTSLLQAKGMITGDSGFGLPWAADGVSFAVGTEYRKYTAKQESDLLSQANDLGGAGGAAPNVFGAYEVVEGIGEILVPVIQDLPGVQSLTVGGGIRYSSYSVDAPGNPSYNTFTWKGEATWDIAAGFKVRGNYAHAVRAPNIYELFYPLTTGLTSLSLDPCAGEAPLNNANLYAVCLAQGASAEVIGNIGQPSAAQANATTLGSVDMKPESSDSWTVGLVAQPDFLPGFSATLDYYNIKIKNAITAPTPGDAISACFGNITASSATDTACTVIRRNPGSGSFDGDAAGLYLPITNSGQLKTDGIDLTMNYSTQFSDTVGLALGFQGNWTNSSKFKSIPTGLDRECVGYFSVNCASIQPEFSFNQRTTLSVSDLDFSLNWRYISSVKFEPQQLADDLEAATELGCPDPSGTDPDGCMVDERFRNIGAASYFDFSLRANINENLIMTFSAFNIFDKQPKVVGASVGSTSYNSGNVYPSTYDALGRRFAITARLRF
ncbi:TonB-dependent receptor domain-containing protein [Sandaracinobacteroides hominis]|uniref:TonB-dependent receptor domain-containing protein n=1 Tax=Sandaracinobacteroides hominis TaxID=2780086 RepID=UPI0018F7385E|nr:TonB-dependent receptor [Sandaracinobacteroides hominis]